MKWEIKKYLSVFNLVLFSLLLVFVGRMIWTRAHDERHYTYEGERYTATGAELREKNRELGERYEGQVVDDDLFADFEVLVSDGLALDENGKARFDRWLYGTSLYTYSEFFDLGIEHFIGDHYTDTRSVFQIDPPRYAYTDGWNEINNCLTILNYTITIVCIFAAAFLFPSEYQNGMISVMHTTVNGREKTAAWKFFTVFLLSSIVCMLLDLLFSGIILAIWGADGAGAAIQLFSSGRYITVSEQINCVTLVSIRILCGLLGLCGAVAVTLAISAYSPNPYIAVIWSLAAYFVPYFAKPGKGLSAVFSFLPFHVVNAFSGDWLAFAPFSVMTALYVLTTAFLCILSFLLCRRRFSRWTMYTKK